jgi:hypothetical protein
VNDNNDQTAKNEDDLLEDSDNSDVFNIEDNQNNTNIIKENFKTGLQKDKSEK